MPKGGGWCCVIDCSGNGGHIFPSDAERRKQWEIAVRRVDENGKPWLAKRYTRLCSKHFREQDFFPDYDEQGIMKVKRLRPGVIPTLFMGEDSKKTDSRKRRLENSTHFDQNPLKATKLKPKLAMTLTEGTFAGIETAPATMKKYDEHKFADTEEFKLFNADMNYSIDDIKCINCKSETIKYENEDPTNDTFDKSVDQSSTVGGETPVMLATTDHTYTSLLDVQPGSKTMGVSLLNYMLEFDCQDIKVLVNGALFTFTGGVFDSPFKVICTLSSSQLQKVSESPAKPIGYPPTLLEYSPKPNLSFDMTKTLQLYEKTHGKNSCEQTPKHPNISAQPAVQANRHDLNALNETQKHSNPSTQPEQLNCQDLNFLIETQKHTNTYTPPAVQSNPQDLNAPDETQKYSITTTPFGWSVGPQYLNASNQTQKQSKTITTTLETVQQDSRHMNSSNKMDIRSSSSATQTPTIKVNQNKFSENTKYELPIDKKCKLPNGKLKYEIVGPKIKKNFPCSVCKKIFYDQNTCDEHSSLHLYFDLPTCLFFTKDNEKELNTANDDVLSKPVNCFVCGQLFLTKPLIISHIIKSHLDVDVKEVNCEYQNRVTVLKGFTDWEKDTLSKEDQCHSLMQDCADILFDTNKLDLNWFRHECIKCRFKFLTKDLLFTHMTTNHLAKEFSSCLNKKEEEDFHFWKKHSKDKMCHICGKLFSKGKTGYLLKNHILEHQGKFRCTICKLNFPMLNCLKSHQKVHLKNRPIVEKTKMCTVCGKVFSYAPNLKIHMATHTGEKIFTCTVCPQKFSKTSHLNKHRKTFHDLVRNHKCRVCGSLFSQDKFLKIHFSKHHLGDQAIVE